MGTHAYNAISTCNFLVALNRYRSRQYSSMENLKPLISELAALVALDNPSEEELNQIIELTAQIDQITNQSNPSEEEEEMNAPELKTVVAPEQVSLMAQVQKAMPDLLKGANFSTEVSLKTLAVSGTNTSNTGGTTIGMPAQFAGFHPTALPTKNRLYDLMPKRGVTGQAVSYVQLGLTNNAAIVKELALKPNSGIPANSITKEIQTWAHWVEISKQVMADAAGLDTAIGQLLVTGLIRKIDDHIFSELATNATVWTPTLTGSDIFAEAAVTLESAGAQQVAVFVNPTDYLAVATMKASTSGVYLGMSPMSPTNVIASASVPAGSILAFDPSAVAFFERELAGVQVGYHGDQFVRNAATLLCEARGLAAVLNPSLVIAGALPDGK